MQGVNMLKIKLAAIAALVLVVGAGTSRAQQTAQPAAGGQVPDGKVALINTTVFPAQITELKQKYDQVDNQFKDRYERLRNLENQLKQMESDIRTKQQVLAPDKLQQMQSDYDELKKKGTRDYEDLKSDYDKAIDVATKPIRDKLYQFIERYAAQRGIVLVINLAGAAQTGMLAYWHPASDITDEFVAEYNKANPVAGAPASTQPAAARPAAKPPAKPGR
jgi:Skp family chaperone for outer membrane proteins